MKTLFALLASALLALLLSALLLQDAEETVPGLRANSPSAPAALDSAVPSDVEVVDIEAAGPLGIPEALDPRAALDTRAESNTTVPTAMDGPSTHVEGRVVDQEGEPLVGTRLQLCLYGAPEGAELPELPRLGNEGSTRQRIGVEGLTDASGAFGLEAPFGAETIYWLEIAADRFHDSGRLRFGRDGVPPLVKGQMDVGEIRLAATGSIFGTVTGVRGQPLADVKMDTGPGPSTTYSRGSISNADGTFVIPHAIVGTYMVKAKLEGYLSKQAEGVTVLAGEDTGPIEMVLEDAPRMEGRVVDESGTPIEKVRLWGWPKSSGSGAGARTKADGTFVVFLPQAEPYSLEATHPDYQQWGDDRGEDYEPGTNHGTITLRKAPQVTFRLVDKANNEPISAFGIKIARNEGAGGGGTFHRLPRLTDHPDGTATLGATPRRDGYVAYAPGFLMQTGAVLPVNESGAPQQRILMDRGAGVKGRLMKDGEPMTSAPIDFTPGSGYRDAFTPVERLSFKVQSGSDGTFETTGLPAPGKVRLTATRPDGGAPRVLMLEGLESGEVRDLGNIEFVEGGTVSGRVLLPEGIDPGGITIYRGDWREDINQVTDSEGHFRFENVPAGKSTFGQRGRPEIIEDGGSVEATVEPNAVTEVVLDLREYALVDVTLEIDLGEHSAAGLSVRLYVPAPAGQAPKLGVDSRRQVALGTTDEQGFVSARCPAVNDARVEVSLPHGQRLQNEGDPLSIAFGPPFAERVSFGVSTLMVKLGKHRDLLTDGKLRLDFAKPGGGPFHTHFIYLPLKGGELQPGMGEWATLTGTDLTLHGIAQGEWDITAYATKKGAPWVKVKLPSGGTRSTAKREFEFTSSVILRPGKTTILEETPR